jgi:hypothetical protein
MTMHRRGAVQSSEVVQFSSSVNTFRPQKQSPSVVSVQWQLAPQKGASNMKQSGHVVSHGGNPYWANAGVRRLDSTGADQAMAAPAPMRFSILRREIRSGLIVIPPSLSIGASMEGEPGRHIVPERELSYATARWAP